ncbi:MAG: Ig-like domain-containing protein [Spirochaetia bacterium]|nr:Ig-like domain-containing protein [Spirochaetia bacterium]
MKKYFSVLIIILCLSCGVVDFSPSDSIKVNPSKYNQVVGENEDIYVKFGFSPDHVSAQSAFEIQRMGGRVSGTFKWNDNTMIFTPDKGFEAAQRYLLKYAGEVADTSGKGHKYNIYTPFFYQTKQSAKPAVTKISPADGSAVHAWDRITFSFSVPMAMTSLIRGFSISPEIEYTEEWNEEHTQMVLTPKEQWKEHQIYSFSFSEEVSSADGIPLSEPKSFFLYSGSGAELPKVLSVDTALNDSISYPLLLTGLDGIKNNDAIRVSFSEAMDKDDTEGAFSINPDIEGHICWIDDYTLVFVPDAEWQGETLYSVKIDTSAKSRKGLLLPNWFETSFTPDVIPLKLLNIEGKDADGFPLSLFDSSQEVDIDVGDTLLPENTYTFGFVFNHQFTTASEKEQIYSGIKLKGVFPPALVAPKAMSIFWSGDSRIQVTYTGFIPEGRIYSLDVNGLGKITLRTR